MVERSYPKSSPHPSKSVGRQREMSGSEPGRYYPDKDVGVNFEGDRNRVTTLERGRGGGGSKDYRKSPHRPFESETKG